jgi:hypothetical protein
MTKRRRLRVALLCENPALGHLVIRGLASNGADVVLMHDRRRAASLAFSRHISRGRLPCDDLANQDPLWVAATLNRRHAETPIDLVLAADVPCLKLLAAARRALIPAVFPMPDLDTLCMLDDKATFTRNCQSWDIATPESRYVTGKSALDPAALEAELGYPIVVKPVSSYGSIGVLTVTSREALIRDVLDNPLYDFGRLIVQRFAPGLDVGLAIFARDGQVEQWSTFECRPNAAAQLIHLPELLEAGRTIIQKTRYDGVANFDARFDPASGALVILECNPRFFMRLAVNRFCGVDFVSPGLQQNPICGVLGGKPGRSASPVRELLTLQGAKRVARGEWRVAAALRGVWETVTDPAPAVLRRAGIDGTGLGGSHGAAGVTRRSYRATLKAIRRAVYRAPSMKRMTGPKLFAAMRPEKYSPGTLDSKDCDSSGEAPTRRSRSRIEGDSKVSRETSG